MSSSSQSELKLSDGEQQTVVRQVIRRVMPLMFLGYVIAYIDRVNVGFAQLGMGVELGINAAAYGLAASIFFISYFIFEIPSNILLERFGARRWIARIMISWGIVTVLTGFVNSEHMLYAARFLLGFAEAGFFPGMILYLTMWFRGRDRGKALGWLILAQPIAYIVGGTVGGLILDHIDWFGLTPWRWVFILSGIPAVLLGVVIFLFFPDSPTTAAWLSDRARTWLVSAISTENEKSAEDAPDGSGTDGLRAQLSALRSRRVLHLSAILFFYTVGFYGFNMFVPLILRQINPSYSATNIGVAAIAPYLCGALSTLAGARMTRDTNRLGTVVVVFGGALAVGLLGTITFSEHPTIALVTLSIAAVGCFGFLGPFWSMATNGLPKKHAVVGIALINAVANLGGFFGPYLVGKNSIGTTVTVGLFVPFGSVVIGIALVLGWMESERRRRHTALKPDAAKSCLPAPLHSNTQKIMP